MLDMLTEAMITGSVTLFESTQAERILKAEAKSISAEDYIQRAERIAKLRHKADPKTYFGRDVDQVATQIAQDLNVYVAKELYAEITKAIDDLPSDIEDNVGAAFVELQSDSKLEKFASNPEGLHLLDVLYEAIITGNVSSFESLQAERILIAKANVISPEEFVKQAERIAGLRDKAEDTSIDKMLVDKAGICRLVNAVGQDVSFDQTMIVAKGHIATPRIYLDRRASEVAGFSGWYLGPFDEEKPIENQDQLESLNLYQLLKVRPAILSVMNLPTDYLVVFDRDTIEMIFDSTGAVVLSRND